MKYYLTASEAFGAQCYWIGIKRPSSNLVEIAPDKVHSRSVNADSLGLWRGNWQAPNHYQFDAEADLSPVQDLALGWGLIPQSSTSCR